MHLRFKGWNNIDYQHLKQLVPLDGGKYYRLIVEYKTEKLTTSNRPFFEIYGFNCETFQYIKSDMVEANIDWAKISIEFGIPQECSAAVVRLRRKESYDIDSKISGHLWVKNIEIVGTGDDYFILDETDI